MRAMDLFNLGKGNRPSFRRVIPFLVGGSFHRFEVHALLGDIGSWRVYSLSESASSPKAY